MKHISMYPNVCRLLALMVFGITSLSGPFALASDDLVIASFEGPDYGDWTIEGTAFGKGPAQGTLPGQMHVGGFVGKGLANSFLGGDTATGTLTSPEFKIERRYLRFLIGGGGWEHKTCVNLLVAGKTVRTATGPNTISGGSEELSLAGWDLAEFEGKNARFQIVDQETGGWGHINVDQVVLTNDKPPLLIRDAKHELVAERRFLNFPIKNGGPKRRVTLVFDGTPEPPLDMELADGQADWWAAREITDWKGRKIQIIVDQMPEESKAFGQLKQSDSMIGEENLYHERLRPQFHFSPKRGWNNDPNGMVFFEGKFHLFFQHNPYGWSWGNMHWGHAVSPDLVHWREEAETLYPDRFGPMFSGSGVVDWNNTSGFGTGGVPPIVLIYTAAGDPTVQCLAYSVDRGKTFIKYGQNPVLGQITGGNRDPKVIFHKPTNQWVMTLYVERHDKVDPSTKKPPVHTIQFFTSPNLKDWKYASEIDGFFECPDFFPLAIDGKEDQTKWVLTAASSEYMIGSFDGRTFAPETPKLQGHRGRGFYAAQTFSDLPKSRRVQIGWLQAESPGMSFNQAMSLPLELELTKTSDGPRLRWQPVEELKKLQKCVCQASEMTLKADSPNPFDQVKCDAMELDIRFKPHDSTVVSVMARGIKIVYDAKTQELSINGHRAAAPLQNGQQRLSIFVDRTCVEVFASNGLTYVPFPVIPKPEDLGASVAVEGEPLEFPRLTVYELESIWPKPPKH